MKTKIFKSKEGAYSAIDISGIWLHDNREDIVLVDKTYFFDRIDETHTVVISYHK